MRKFYQSHKRNFHLGFFLIIFLLITSQATKAQTSYGTNLVINGDAQGSLSVWNPIATPTFIQDSPSILSIPDSPNGNYVFDFWPSFSYPGISNESLTQTINITDISTDISNGKVKAVLTGQVFGSQAIGIARIILEQLGATNNVIASSQVENSGYGSWETKTITIDNLNTSTRKLKITLYAQVNANGPSADFDGIDLKLYKYATVTTATATSIAITSATLGGNITVDGNPTISERGIVYSTTDATPTIAEGAIKVTIGSGSGAFSQSVGSLTGAQLYYINAYAINTAGIAYGTATSFTTLTPPVTTAVTDAATNVSITGATLNGTVNANNYSTTVTFQYGLTTGYGTTVTADQSPVSGSSATSVSKPLSGLASSTTYHYRVVAANSTDGTKYGSDQTFTTLTPVSEIGLEQGSNDIADGGSYDFGSHQPSTHIDITFTIENTGTGVLTLTTPLTIGGTNANQFSIQSQPSSSVAVSGSTTFTVRFTPTSIGNKTATISFANNDSNENPYDLTITGAGYLPATVATNTANYYNRYPDGIVATGMTLNGSVNANNNSTSVIFEYGLTSSYGSSVTATQSPVTGTTATSVTYNLAGLTQNTSYHYRTAGTNLGGTTYGSDQTFTTPIVENFTDETGETTTFTEGGTSFAITGYLKVANFHQGWNGSNVDDYLVSNNLNFPPSAGVLGSFKNSSNNFYVNSIWVAPGIQDGLGNVTIGQYGDVIIRGKRAGTTLFTYTLLSSNTNTGNFNYTFVDLSSYNTILIDELEFEGTNNIRYMNIDAFNFNYPGPISPTVTTQAVSAINTTTATGNGNITNLGNPNPTAYGICWKTTSGPTTSDSHTDSGAASATGAFTGSMTGLTAGTIYYVKAYATNSSGTSYGSEMSFTTLTPAITSATYDAGTGSLVLTCTNLTIGDIVNPSKITLTGEGGATYAITTPNVIASSTTSVTITLNGTDKAAVNQILNKNGTSSTSSTTYNLSVADDWDSSVTSGNTADATNGITVSNVAVPTITSATYDASTGALIVTGAGFLKLNGTTNDIDVSKFTITGEGGSTRTLTTTSVEITSGTSFTVTLNATDLAVINQLINKNGTISTGATPYNLAAAEDWAAGADAAVVIADLTSNGITASNVAVPTITSATYNAATGTLVVTGTGFLKLNGANNDIDVSKLSIVGEGGSSYTLTTTSVEITSGTSFTVTLNATDLAAANQIINKNGTSSTGATTYNLTAAEDWAAGADAAVVVADLTSNGITASNVAVPTITSATYNAATGALVVTGTGFFKLNGANNDIDVSKLTITGEGGSTYTLTTTSIEITSGTSFTVTLNATDLAAVNQIINKNGTSSTGATTYNLAAAENWAAGADAAVVVADLTGNGITTSNVAVPTITSATYNVSTGVLVVTGTGFLSKSGSTNDIVANKFTLTGEGGATYTLTDTPNVEITSGTSFILTLSSTDRAAFNLLLNKNGTSSTSGTTYNLAAAEDWAAGADVAVVVADLTGNGITASNVAVPTITGATYNATTGSLVVTGTGFLPKSGSTNDIVANNFTLTGEGGATYTLTDTPNVEITSGTTFTLTLSTTDKNAVNQIINKNGTSSIDVTTYNLAAAEDWAAGADAAVVIADLTGNGIIASGLSGPTVTTQAVTAINVTSATGNGNITNLGVPNPTQYGVVWSTSSGPTTALSTKTTQGATSSTGAFTSNITGLLANTHYYVIAYATNSAGTSYGSEVQFTTLPSATTISGTTNWSTVAQWDNGVPASSSDVTVNGGIVTVDGTYTVKNATVNASGGLSIGSGQMLNVTGNLVLKSDGTNTSSLIINNGGTLNITGTVTVERYMLQNKWYIISPTASGQSVADFLTANTNIPTSGSNRGMREYNTTANVWYPYFTTGSGTMTSGKGYAARISTNGVVNFVGTLTFGDKSVAVTRTDDNGWNCIGNPYTSAIHIDAAADATNNFLTLNSSNLDPSYSAIYVWDESGTNDGTHNYYDVVSNADFTLPKTQLGQDRVQVGQGFFVKVKTSPTNVIFKPAMQIHQNSLPLKTSKVSWPAIELTVKADSLNAYTDIAYNERMTPGLDPTYDAGLLRGNSKLNIYSHLINDNGVDFAIQCLPDKQIESQVVPIGIDYLKGGQVQISALTTGLPLGMNVVLEDRLNKTFTQLSTDKEINVTVDPNTKGIGRFYLHTTALSVNDLKTISQNGNLNAYTTPNNEIRIIGEVSSKAIATLFDTQGKAILSQNLKESNLNVILTSNIKTGIYMLSVRDTGKLQSFKLFIKQ